MKRLVLLDTHAILHRAYHALPDFATSKGEPTGALYGLVTMLLKIVQELKPNYIVAAFDLASPTYRHEAYKDYKAGRAKTDPDLSAQITRSRDLLEALSIPIYDKAGFEADDMLGTITEQLKGKKDVEIIIASGDMDTLQLVSGEKVKVYTLRKGIQDTVMYDEKAVNARFGFGPELLPDYKGLRGDPSDNIVGVKGIGEKTATTLIQEFGSIEDLYKKLKKDKKAFEKVKITPRIIGLLEENKEEAEFSKMLATIRRDAPIAFSLPEKEWVDLCDLKKAQALFDELEFRTLGSRLAQTLGVKVSEIQKEEKKEETADPDTLKRLKTMLWVVDSHHTNPEPEEILRFTKTATFAEAEKVLMSELEKRNVKKVYEEIELPLFPVTTAMTERGIKIDVGYLDKLSKQYHTELSKLEKNIWEAAGEEFNVNSPRQLGAILFEKMGLKAKGQKKTAGGAMSTRESELEKLKDLHPVIAHILKYRELQKLLSTYIDTLPHMADKEGRIHAEFVQSGSTTGRMSSQNPNLQNIPIKTELGRNIRNAFVVDKGYELVEFDYSQIELRVAAFLSKDEKLIDIFRSGRDVHTEVAAQVFKVAPDKVDKEMRRRAKVINFGILYGMGVNALKQNLGTDRAEAQLFYNEYFATFPTLATYLDHVKAETERRGYTETYFGRRRYFEGITSKLPHIKAMAERMAINAPIQGTEADVIKIAMARIDSYFREKKMEKEVGLLLQVHDSLVFEIKKEKVEEAAKEIKRIMESVIDPKNIFDITLRAEGSRGPTWGEMKKL